MDRISAAADAIAASRLGGVPLDVLPAAIRPLDEAEAYRVQAAVHERLAERFGPRKGYKIACTTAVMQAYLAVHNPCSAGVFAGGIHRSGAIVGHGAYRRIGVECEIAVRLAHDLVPDSKPFTAGSVAGGVAEYMAAIEIVDDRYADWRRTDTPTLIADDFFAAGCVLGEPVRAAAVPDAAKLVGTTVINGTEAGRGVGADVMGHPLAALAWLANGLAARGSMLRQGEIVLTGSLVETKWLARGDRVTIAVAGLGAAALAVD